MKHFPGLPPYNLVSHRDTRQAGPVSQRISVTNTVSTLRPGTFERHKSATIRLVPGRGTTVPRLGLEVAEKRTLSYSALADHTFP